MNSKNRRRKIFKVVREKSKRKLQFEFVKLTGLILLATIIVLTAGINVVFHVVLSTAQLGRYAEAQLKTVYFWINWFSVGVAIISFLIGTILALHFSHRIAGPLYRIETMLKEAIANDKPLEIKIRRDDYLHELVELINQFMLKRYKQ